MDEVSKTERERQLDEKIKAMRAKNAMALERKKEVDKDRQLAEISKSSITSVTKSKADYSEPYVVNERIKTRPRIKQDDVTDGPKDPSKRFPTRMLDSEGPPPDPGYRFLADRMRDEDKEEGGSGKGREHSHTKSLKGKSVRGKARPGKHDESARERRPLDKTEEDEIVIVLEKDRHGRIQNHNSPLSSNSEERRAFVRPAEKKPMPVPQSAKEGKPPPRIKSLFDDEEEDDDYIVFLRNERWNEDNKLSSPRKIEDQGGKLTITRTVENFKSPELPQEKCNRVESKPAFPRNPLSAPTGSPDIVVSQSTWQCSDPSCNTTNSPGSIQCSKCKLAFIKSHEYKNNHACDKYKQEFNSKKSKPSQYLNGSNPIQALPPQPMLSQNNGVREAKLDHSIEVIPYTNDWVGSPAGISQWPPPQEIMMQPYGMMLNHSVPMPNYPPPPQLYEPRHIAPAPQYFPDFVPGGTYPVNAHYNFPTPPGGSSTFNPGAQAFIPSSDPVPMPPSIYQTPPPPINTKFNTNAAPTPLNSTDANLVLSLRSPPKPLAMKRTIEPRKSFPDRSRIHEGGMSRSGDKNTQYLKTPPRIFQNRDITTSLKPPSMIEMQSGSLKKGSVPLPPPKNKGKGLLIFGTSNVVNNVNEDALSEKLSLPVRLVPAMKLEAFTEVVTQVNSSTDWLVLIHGLGEYLLIWP